MLHHRFLRAAVMIGIAACANDNVGARPDRAVALDDFGDPVTVSDPPRRIVSLNPTTTELLFALGAGARVVGRTHWDEWPEAARAVPDLGPGVRPNVEAVLAAHPDLVLLYASADNRPAAIALRDAGIRTLSLKIDRIEHFARATRLLGRVLGDSAGANVVVDSVLATLDSVRAITSRLRHPRVIWPVDLSPLVVIGGGSFLSQLIDIAGGANVYGDVEAVSPQLSLEDALRRNPEIVIANPQLAARIRGEAAWRALPAVRNGRIVEADEVLMGRPSVRMGEAAVALSRLLHPDGASNR